MKTDRIAALLLAGFACAPAAAAAPVADESGPFPWKLIGAVVVAVAVAAIVFSLFRKGNKGWGWVCVGLLVVGALAILWLIREIVENGLGAFGGSRSYSGLGSSGGGGATGRW
jgi:uncharacterized membrane protein YgcG